MAVYFMLGSTSIVGINGMLSSFETEQCSFTSQKHQDSGPKPPPYQISSETSKHPDRLALGHQFDKHPRHALCAGFGAGIDLPPGKWEISWERIHPHGNGPPGHELLKLLQITSNIDSHQSHPLTAQVPNPIQVLAFYCTIY